MTSLQSPIKEQIESLISKSNEEFEKANHAQSIQLLEDAWGKIPAPKGLYEDSYHIVKDIIDTCFINKDFSKAKEWSEKMFLTGFARIDSGERDFYAGKIAFELGELEVAKEFFSIADKKSEGRCFEDEDTKYLKFFKK
ncbi:hypothetical protein [Pelosinus sp. IPA-1]|uniref:hypothetical protein n=1 Tax=Pelosinus sp. IPA-1 TaxID=3029569 RepID=UPI0024362664|nr:hypothetical protein [Pelosinus sp. IPA-1]GMA98790.1 hypothetical protein PIPA1_15900 [Pelosinus sp. IPA-1]